MTLFRTVVLAFVVVLAACLGAASPASAGATDDNRWRLFVKISNDMDNVTVPGYPQVTPPAPVPTPVPGPNPPSPAPTPTPPGAVALTGLGVSRASFTTSQGTFVRYRLNASANVRLTFYNRAAPKRVYTYAIRAGRPGADAGQNRVFINGRVRGRAVRSGRWVMRVSAVRNGVDTPPATRRLTLRAR
ncbi:MAG: hypothetical protein FJW99_08035 [Actinobacteria bacterium]|nr:hypothetical protein [Actinomycetota bacterium]MBM3698175.1 hypothetical protein [Actinomycetota bacterium]